jgi:uncharacterized protein (TIGR00369 family)
MAAGDHHRRLERMYLKAPVNAYFNPSIQIRDGEADIVIPIQPAFFHAAHAVHGSVYFKAMDDAAFFAVNSLVEDVFVLTASFNLYLLRPISAGEMRATGRVVQASRRLFVAEAELVDADGRLIATGTGTFMRSGVALGPEVGYE